MIENAGFTRTTLLRATIALGVISLLATVASGMQSAAAERSEPAGYAILARSDGDALLIWDASADVAAIVTKGMPDEAARALLERDAARVLAASVSRVAPDATTISVRIIYDRTGAVSPVYDAPTFAGVERYAVLKLAGADARADRDRWRERTAGSPLPRWFAFTVTGALPER